MTRISKPRRGRRPAKRLDLTDMKAALADSRQWTALGVVVQPTDGSPHWQIVGDSADVMVELELQPEQVPVTARLAAGMWIVPAVGDEVAVILPAGELDFMPTIACILAHSVPSSQGPQPNRIVLASGEVLVHDGAGGAVALAKASELQALASDFYGHGHPSNGAGPIPTFTPPDPPGDPLVDPGQPGTEVLKGK